MLTMAADVKLTDVNSSQVEVRRFWGSEVQSSKVLGFRVQRFWGSEV